MDHLAIMSSKGRLIDKIVSGEKPIESRWYKTKRSPWNNIKPGDIIYFKESGKPVIARATVEKIDFHETQGDNKTLFEKVQPELGVGLEYYEKIKEANYAILIKLKSPKYISPFEINKKGYGSGNAWITLDSIIKIRRNEGL